MSGSTARANTGRTPTPDTDVVIVGAGLAGLATAHQLTTAGLRVTVLEAEDRVGGRMATDRVDGYRLDRSTGLVSADWSEMAQLPGLAGLVLRPFSPGALLHADGRTHRVGSHQRSTAVRLPYTPQQFTPRTRAGRIRADHRTRGALDAARVLTSTRGRTARTEALDLVRLRVALARLASLPVDELAGRVELPTAQALSQRGLPARTVESLVRPLLEALLCDPELGTSSRVADLTLRSFARAGLCLPAGGLAAVPELLAAGLPEGTIRTGVRAEALTTHAVTTESHGTLNCRATLVATGAVDAARLLPGLRVPEFHPVTVLHHAAHEPPPRHCSALLVDADARGRTGDRAHAGPVSHSWVSTAVDPSRALPGRTLVTSVVLGPRAAEATATLDAAARPQLAALHGASTARWELLAAFHDPRAVPATPTPHDPNRPVRLLSGLYVCGDHRDTSTAQGALTSAGRATREILRDFGIPLTDTDSSLNAVA
ncbi:NAD(P)/FAD-dependent oxidoreductase [Streptomyces sp. AJS327]|uniref:NAD(P)/FAD-dependent oxidoreductase n=1 Tax=Streptomyces sp. AJS327 TaxID=2545265 RepID=UPI0027E521AA|nr:NAD(P)/FAD-dependent oxidoreductase [Streptomyces sp. AJS327]